jgi:tRNA (adenine57-N1/adenine58-N1)-methyltransferase
MEHNLDIAPCQTTNLMRLSEPVIICEPFPEPNSCGAFPQTLTAAVVAPSGCLPTPHARYSQKELFGRPYGSVIGGTVSAPAAGGEAAAAPSAAPVVRARAAALRLTPELWTLSLPHRTQILFTADISLIVTHLGLRPGSVVVESGTGSGSLTHALARAVAPGGAVHTFEFNAARVEQARNEFLAHGLAAVTRVMHRDAVVDGFCIGGGAAGGVPRGGADAVFLDLPSPWEAVGNAAAALRAGGALCSFSPCIEQVARTADALRAAGFEDVRTFETLLRPWGVRGGGGDAPLRRAVELGGGGGGGGGGVAGSGGCGGGRGGSVCGKRLREGEEGGGEGNGGEGGGGWGASVSGGCASGDAPAPPAHAPAAAEEGGGAPPFPLPPTAAAAAAQPPPFRPWPPLPPLAPVRLQPHARVRGHTGYLTFCRAKPAP